MESDYKVMTWYTHGKGLMGSGGRWSFDKQRVTRWDINENQKHENTGPFKRNFLGRDCDNNLQLEMYVKCIFERADQNKRRMVRDEDGKEVNYSNNNVYKKIKEKEKKNK